MITLRELWTITGYDTTVNVTVYQFPNIEATVYEVKPAVGPTVYYSDYDRNFTDPIDSSAVFLHKLKQAADSFHTKNGSKTHGLSN